MSYEPSAAAKYGYALAGFGAIVGVGFLVHLLTMGDEPARSNPAPRKYPSFASGYWIDDPEMRPAAVAKRLVAAIKKQKGKSAKVTVRKAEADTLHGWTYRDYIVLDVEGTTVSMTLNVAVGEEASGIANIEGIGPIPVPRAANPKQVEAWLTSEIVGHVGGRV